jgi:hypothetical protein
VSHPRPIDGKSLDDVRQADVEHAAIQGLDLSCQVIAISHDNHISAFSREQGKSEQ